MHSLKIIYNKKTDHKPVHIVPIFIGGTSGKKDKNLNSILNIF